MELIRYDRGKIIESFSLYVATGLMLLVSSLSVVNIEREAADSIGFALVLGIFYIAGILAAWVTRHNKRKENTMVLIEVVSLFFSFLVSSIVIGSSEVGMFLAYFLIILQVCRNFFLYSQRDFRFAYLIGIVLIILASFSSKQTAFVFYLILYVIAGIFTLIYDYLSEYPRESVVGSEKQNTIGLLGLGTGVSILVMGLSVLIYLVLPRFPSLNIQAFPSSGWGDYENEDWEREGHSRTLNLRIRNGAGEKSPFEGVSLPNPIIMYVRTNRPLYLREGAFDYFDANTWSIKGISKEKIEGSEGYFKIGGGNSISEYKRAYQSYYIKEDLPNLIFSAYLPSEMAFPSEMIEKDDALILRAPKGLKKGTKYSVISHIPIYSPNLLIYDKSNYPFHPKEIKDTYLQLPKVSPRVAELSREITQRFTSDYQKAVAIESYLRINYTYTLKHLFSVYPEGMDLVDHFLFELKEGHCEFFATSMAVMCRFLGLPSRLITGHVACKSNYNPFTGYYEIRSLGHAWVEVYFKDHGWVPFSPTPSGLFDIRVAEEPGVFVASSLSQYVIRGIEDYLKSSPQTFWQRLIHKLLLFIKRLWNLVKNTIEEILQSLRDIFFKMVLIITRMVEEFGLYLLFLAILLITLVLFWRCYLSPILTKRREDRLSGEDPKSFVILGYCKMCKAIGSIGYRRLEYQTATEYASILKGQLSNYFDSISTITELFIKARYSSHQITEEDCLNVKQALDSLLKRLKKMGWTTPISNHQQPITHRVNRTKTEMPL